MSSRIRWRSIWTGTLTDISLLRGSLARVSAPPATGRRTVAATVRPSGVSAGPALAGAGLAAFGEDGRRARAPDRDRLVDRLPAGLCDARLEPAAGPDPPADEALDLDRPGHALGPERLAQPALAAVSGGRQAADNHRRVLAQVPEPERREGDRRRVALPAERDRRRDQRGEDRRRL